MTSDPSAGWEGVAAQFAAIRSDIGVDIVERWSRHIRPGGAILDIGCGTGRPMAQALSALGFEIYGIDASPTLLAAFRRHLPQAKAACEAVETSRFFGRTFDGILAIGLMFLLDERDQSALITRIARYLEPDGHFLFTAPRDACRWNDSLTGRASRSLGWDAYTKLLGEAGFETVGWDVDKGGNHCIHARVTPKEADDGR